MSAYTLCEKFIKAKTYSKNVIENRVNAFFMFGQVSPKEYAELMELIKVNYPETNDAA